MSSFYNRPVKGISWLTVSLILLSNAHAMDSSSTDNKETEAEHSQQVMTTELTQTQKDIQGLLDMLVEQNVIKENDATIIKDKINKQAQAQAVKENAEQAALKKQEQEAKQFRGVKVNYVPEFVKDEIRDSLRIGMQEDVIGAVMSQAKNEAWAIPNSWPTWLNRLSFNADLRLRLETESFGANNTPNFYNDFNYINKKGVLDPLDPDSFLNTTEDRQTMRLRARFGFKAKINEKISTEFRLATGNTENPVSTNQTLGDELNNYTVTFDRAAFIWKSVDIDNYPWLDFVAGRFKNPFFSTDLIWDKDINLDGFAFNYRQNLHGSGDLFAMERRDRTLFANLGVFPIKELELSSDDKWLIGSQIGAEFIFRDQSSIKFALGYYDFLNMEGKINSEGSNLQDPTAPDFMQKGNTIFNIARSSEVNSMNRRFALASDYNLVDFNMLIDIASFAPEHLIISLNYVKNTGFDKRKAKQNVSNGGDVLGAEFVEDRTDGYRISFLYGWPQIGKVRDWNLQFGYKYLEADAVVDAYTDSDFHGGGTDAKGWWLKAAYGIEENTALSLKYSDTSEIDYAELNQSVLQLDLTTYF